ncbi:protein kinase [Corallococcus sp. bb12-1]|uniref:serine/threonine-protein kinase n=1 Tax=Corallococcus sp. bb12-1 TaxID=2996784 RepID=UPI00227155D8|nr:serine/threonine protein kinase [Corallococcus sp. bb12-1]MCY1039986.1 protein kinase [Corallococcus sp. bb12-1]
MSSSTQPARLRPFRPQPFGRYTLLSHLATGGMGEIYLARLEGAQGFEKLCVIKKILPQLAADQEFVERFVGEARTLVRLGHGSIAQVLDMGLHEDEAYMALEYVDGKDLRKVAARVRDRQTPLPLTFILYVMGRVLDALAYAHRKRDEEEKELKLVHRDISPQNILISYEGEVKVIDFGLAKSRLSAAKTNPSIILGKFLYMSPEQARHQPVDRRSDLYAVGLCLYELISGQNPFDAMPPGELMSAVANPKVPALNEVEPLTPPSVSQLVSKALAVEPGQRFQTAEEFRGRLQACLMEIDTSAGPESVSRFMRDLFSSDYQSERRLLATLREVPRETRASGTYDALGAPPRPSLPPKTIRLDGPLEPLSFHPTPRSREDGGGARDDGETRPGVMVDESTRPAFPVEALEEAARARARPSPASSEPSPTVEVRAEAMERPTILEGLPAIRLPSDRPAQEASSGQGSAGMPAGEPTAPRAEALLSAEPGAGEPTAPRAASLPSSEPSSQAVSPGASSRPFADAGSGASLPFSDAVPPRAAPPVEARPPPPPRTVAPPPPPMAAVPAFRSSESAASGRPTMDGPVPVVPADASRPVPPPPPLPSADFGAAQFGSDSGGSLPFMEPPPPPDGPMLDDEDLPPSAYPWPEPRAEAGWPSGSEPRTTEPLPRSFDPPRVAEPRIPEAMRPTAVAIPSLSSSRPGVTTPSNGSRPAPAPPAAPLSSSRPGVTTPSNGSRPAPAPQSSSRPGVTTPSNGSRPMPSHAAPTIQVPSIQSGGPPYTSSARVEMEALGSAPAPRPTMQDTRPESEQVLVDAQSLEADAGLPYITAEPEEPQAARDAHADTHPRITLPRSSRREEPQARVVLDEALLGEASVSSGGRRDSDTGSNPGRSRTGSRKARGSSPGSPSRPNTSSNLRAVAASRSTPAVDVDESSTSRNSREETRRKAMPVRPEPAEPARPSRHEPAPKSGGGLLRSLLVFVVLLGVVALIVGLGLHFVPELRVAAGLEQSRTSTPPPPTRVQDPTLPTPVVPPSRPIARPVEDVAPPVAPASPDPVPVAPTNEAPEDPGLSDEAALLGPTDSSSKTETPAPAAKKPPPSRVSSKRAAAAPRVPEKDLKAPTELEREWAQTRKLFLQLKREDFCETMQLRCRVFEDLSFDVNESDGTNDPALLKRVKDMHEVLRKAKRGQE